MLGTLIGLLILVIVLGVVWYCIQLLLPLIPMSEPFATIARVLVILILAMIVIYIVLQLLAAGGIHVPRL